MKISYSLIGQVMRSNSILVFLVCAGAFSGQARQPPNLAYVEKYFGIDSSGHSRFSDNLFEDATLDVPDLIRKYGYPCEAHEVVTEDGYILEMHRIPHGRDQNNQPDPNRPVVIVMHGLLVSSADYVMMGPGTALGYVLAEAGYDVWLGNARGTFYSRKHVTLDPNGRRDLSYWDFSWDEIGQYDLPAMIDYALKVTGKSRLHYIGHSQGTVVFWVMGALRPEYNEKIITMQAYAPVAYLEYNENPLFVAVAPHANNIVSLLSLLGIGDLFPRDEELPGTAGGLCADGADLQPICTSFLLAIVGESGDQHNATMFPVKLAHAPAGCSVKQLAHYGQLIGQSFFRRYDHGVLGNLRRYGVRTPPLYDLKKVTAPVFLHYTDPDPFADILDAKRLWHELGNAMAFLRVDPPFSHVDFSWGQHAKTSLYDKTIDIMNLFGAN